MREPWEGAMEWVIIGFERDARASWIAKKYVVDE